MQTSNIHSRCPLIERGFSISIFAIAVFSLLGTSEAFAQKSKNTSPNSVPLLTRHATKHETRRFAYGGQITLVGAPQGSITVEGWTRSEFEITADIELQAPTEGDLDRLAMVNGVVLDEDANHLRILTTGTHDKRFMKSVSKGFPKHLLGLPWKVDYKIRAPVSTNLEINAGRGPIALTSIEGAIQLSATESDATMTLTGGTVAVTIGAGNVGLFIPVRSWRGGGADIRLAAGEVTLELPSGFNGDIEADILRSGSIEDGYGEFESRERPGITPQKLRVRAGSGGAAFHFTIGAGNLHIRKAVASDK